MKKFISKFYIMIIIFYFTISVSIFSNAAISDMASDLKGFQQVGKSRSQQIDTSEALIQIFDIGSILTSIGVAVMLGVTAYMGIKYLTSTPDTKAKLKVQLIGVVVSGMVIFGSYYIWKTTINIASQLEVTDSSYDINQKSNESTPSKDNSSDKDSSKNDNTDSTMDDKKSNDSSSDNKKKNSDTSKDNNKKKTNNTSSNDNKKANDNTDNNDNSNDNSSNDKKEPVQTGMLIANTSVYIDSPFKSDDTYIYGGYSNKYKAGRDINNNTFLGSDEGSNIGLDIMRKDQTDKEKVYCPIDGTVWGWDKNNGSIYIMSDSGEVMVRFVHLQDMQFQKGQTVKKGDYLGQMSNIYGFKTPGSMLPRVDYEILVEEVPGSGKYYNIDPTPYVYQ